MQTWIITAKEYNRSNSKGKTHKHVLTFQQSDKTLTTKGKSHEVPLPLCLAAIVVGPDKEGIQKKPSVRSP